MTKAKVVRTPKEKYEYWMTQLERQIFKFQAAVEAKEFDLAAKLWENLGHSMPLNTFDFAPEGMFSLKEALFHYYKGANHDPKFRDFFQNTFGECFYTQKGFQYAGRSRSVHRRF